MNKQFSYVPLLSKSERNASMGNYYFNQFITKFPYRKRLPSIHNKKRKRSNSVILRKQTFLNTIDKIYKKKRSKSIPFLLN